MMNAPAVGTSYLGTSAQGLRSEGRTSDADGLRPPLRGSASRKWPEHWGVPRTSTRPGPVSCDAAHTLRAWIRSSLLRRSSLRALGRLPEISMWRELY
jgi:hypothetical protein